MKISNVPCKFIPRSPSIPSATCNSYTKAAISPQKHIPLHLKWVLSDRPPLVNSHLMDPITAWTIAKEAGEITKKLYEFGKSLKDREAKKKVDEILDQLRELKQSASELEDQNRDLREQKRFKSDEYEFRIPFWYDKAHPDRPLCPKCHASHIDAPVAAPARGQNPTYRRCLVCMTYFDSVQKQQ